MNCDSVHENRYPSLCGTMLGNYMGSVDACDVGLRLWIHALGCAGVCCRRLLVLNMPSPCEPLICLYTTHSLGVLLTIMHSFSLYFKLYQSTLTRRSRST